MAITKEEIIAKCSPELIASRDCTQIAAVVSVGRKTPNKREIGYGTIIETLGLLEGNKLADELNNNVMYRYVKPLVEQGRMLIGSVLVASTLASMVPSVISQESANKLLALGYDDEQCTPLDVANALYNPDGSFK